MIPEKVINAAYVGTLVTPWDFDLMLTGKEEGITSTNSPPQYISLDTGCDSTKFFYVKDTDNIHMVTLEHRWDKLNMHHNTLFNTIFEDRLFSIIKDDCDGSWLSNDLFHLLLFFLTFLSYVMYLLTDRLRSSFYTSRLSERKSDGHRFSFFIVTLQTVGIL